MSTEYYPPTKKGMNVQSVPHLCSQAQKQIQVISETAAIASSLVEDSDEQRLHIEMVHKYTQDVLKKLSAIESIASSNERD